MPIPPPPTSPIGKNPIPVSQDIVQTRKCDAHTDAKNNMSPTHLVWGHNITNLLSAEFAKRVVKVNMLLSLNKYPSYTVKFVDNYTSTVGFMMI